MKIQNFKQFNESVSEAAKDGVEIPKWVMSLLTRTVKDQLNVEADSKSNQKLVAEIVELSDKLKELSTPAERKSFFAKSSTVKSNADLKAILKGMVNSYDKDGKFKKPLVDYSSDLPKWFTSELTVALKKMVDEEITKCLDNPETKSVCGKVSTLLNQIGKVSTVSDRKPFFAKISKVKTMSDMEGFLKGMLRSLSKDKK
jgi:hypothetical protein